MDVNDLVYEIAARAKVLGDKRLSELRLTYGTEGSPHPSAALRMNAHLSRGELIELILEEEFIEEFPREIANE